jgi:hypothetical protein
MTTEIEDNMLFHDNTVDHRFLQNDDPNADTRSQSTILRTTFQVYGPILIVCFLLFCYVRQRFPKAYTIRDWADDVKVCVE